MTDQYALRRTFRYDEPLSKRERRAEATLRWGYSPVRFLMLILSIPVMTLAITVSAAVRMSPYPPEDAIRHLAALAGCETAAAVGLAPATRGGIGYHQRNDPDGDGVACPLEVVAAAQGEAPERRSFGAKFLRP